MNDCKFCRGEWIHAEYVGEGITTMMTNLKMVFGMSNDDKEYDGIHLIDGNMLAFDNSSGEYADQMVAINYCPFCGEKVEPKEGV